MQVKLNSDEPLSIRCRPFYVNPLIPGSETYYNRFYSNTSQMILLINWGCPRALEVSMGLSSQNLCPLHNPIDPQTETYIVTDFTLSNTRSTGGVIGHLKCPWVKGSHPSIKIWLPALVFNTFLHHFQSRRWNICTAWTKIKEVQTVFLLNKNRRQRLSWQITRPNKTSYVGCWKFV